MAFRIGIPVRRDFINMGDYLNKPADPFNDFEPVDSSAAAIGCTGTACGWENTLKHKGEETSENITGRLV